MMVRGTSFNHQLLAQRAGAAVEQALPQSVTEHHDGRGLALLADIVRLDGPCRSTGCTPRKLKRPARQQNAVKTFRTAIAAHQHRLIGGGHDVGEGRKLLDLDKLAAWSMCASPWTAFRWVR